MNYVQVVTDAAKNLNLLDEQGRLMPLDSLTVLDLVNELERVTNISIPTTEIQDKAFESLAAVAALLEKVHRG